MSDKIKSQHLQRKAMLYVRQSSAYQVSHNLESQKLQYAMQERLQQLGWRQIEVVDEDLGRSAAGTVTRAGFERMVSEVCLGKVGAVAAREVSRFARNSREWQQLVEVCRVVDTVLIDQETVYAPRQMFDGMKAHKSADGRPLLFRPRENARRLQRSAARLAIPVVPESLFLEGLRELVRMDQAWIPPADVGALYIRPILFSVDPSIRVKPADRCRFLILTFPFGAYFSAPVDVLVCERYVRAFPGGTGDTKPAGNYAAGLLAEQEAREAGFASVMWLDAQERRYVEECGAGVAPLL